MTPPSLHGLADWLRAEFGEREPLKRGGPPQVQRLALALEPADLPPEVDADALFVHRSLRVGERWPGLGVLGVHDGFDLALTTGPNHRLARALGWRDVREVVWKGELKGITATPPQDSWAGLRAALHAELGGEDSSWPPAPGPEPLRLALMNAMNPGLIEHVAAGGVRVYLTGQLRPSASAAAQAHGLGVIALGHRRTEAWGLRQLAAELRAAFPGLHTEVYGSEG
ncbi:Nif3-like dinuclear metal center hexameric protein [Deinococcus radiopugnans]|uniref:NIF3 family GTP cyclohydrolase 1 type 2 n=1 Tax=Deinococcus radiopugnans ATCC 19172 TaxID=585398 RepID=A0A5C4Y7U1_9DEIO|nr:Nif3-like dinuclear metal center hexameric protein [Deinococcus radiopugnans]MBB6014954.1 putative NIF3 family GTP cyclohydrolase 1 type 2 [Deinococcus radiopugnans ATCC 19172]TNM71635.1 Nif3-like dinuclear metal center hexameric protein [Deinococcus radiopugnans ATCC 19172]